MDSFDQLFLCLHYSFDRLVGRWSFIDHVRIFSALDSRSHSNVILNRESPLGFPARHGPAGTVAAALKAFAIPQTSNDKTPRAHAAGDYPKFARACPDCALPCDKGVRDIKVEVRRRDGPPSSPRSAR